LKKITLLTCALAVLITLAVPHRVAQANVQDRLFDFTDDFYKQNGVDPTQIVNRVNGTAPRSIFDSPFFPFQRNVRALRLNPAYNQSGQGDFAGETSNDPKSTR
jgi:hypothetical protein